MINVYLVKSTSGYETGKYHSLYDFKLAVNAILRLLCVRVGTFLLRARVRTHSVGLGLRVSFDRASSNIRLDIIANLKW